MTRRPISEVFNEDNVAWMKRFPDGYFDLLMADPPYFSGPERRQYYGQKSSKLGVRKLYRELEAWQKPGIEFFTEINRVSRYYIFWGANYFHFPFHTGRIIWDKVNDSSDYSDCEIAATNLFDHVRIFRYMWNGMLQGESVSNGTKMQGNKKLNEKRIHQTQKPIALYKWTLHKYAKEGWRIGDTNLGSQSSRIAAYKMGFDFYGVDIDPYCIEQGNKRFKQETAQLSIL